MTKIILVTGSNGFVGRQILRYLLNQPVRLRLIIRGILDEEFLSHPNIESVIATLDLFDETQAWWNKVCKDVATVVHIAWYTEPGKYLNADENLKCLQGTINLARACEFNKIKRFIGIGTCIEYDLKDEAVSPLTPLNPTTIYSACKASVFLTLNQFFKFKKIDFLWCRLFYLYGEKEDSRRLVSYLKEKLSRGEEVNLSSGLQVRDFMDVKDAGTLIAKLVLGSRTGPVNICSGIPISIREFSQKIADEFGLKSLLKFGKINEDPLDYPYIVGISDIKDEDLI